MSTDKVYKVRVYNMNPIKGGEHQFHVYKEEPFMEVIDAKQGIYGSKFGERHVNGTRSWEFRTTDLTKLKNAYEMTDDLLYLPYFADVTEDLPSSCKFEPTTYKNCQLMVETNCSYKYFFHRETGKKLIIAINSNTYEPILPQSTKE